MTNLAARLCGEAKPGQVLLSQRVAGSVEAIAKAELVGDLTLKGFHRPVKAFNVIRLQESWRGWVGGHPTPDPAPRFR